MPVRQGETIMTVATKNPVKAVYAAWTDRADGGGYNVYAGHNAPDGFVEIYGYVGPGDDADLYTFDDYVKAEQFAGSIAGYGSINSADGRWSCVDCIDDSGSHDWWTR